MDGSFGLPMYAVKTGIAAPSGAGFSATSAALTAGKTAAPLRQGGRRDLTEPRGGSARPLAFRGVRDHERGRTARPSPHPARPCASTPRRPRGSTKKRAAYRRPPHRVPGLRPERLLLRVLNAPRHRPAPTRPVPALLRSTTRGCPGRASTASSGKGGTIRPESGWGSRSSPSFVFERRRTGLPPREGRSAPRLHSSERPALAPPGARGRPRLLDTRRTYDDEVKQPGGGRGG
jgi:hypothetical protein